MAGKRIRLDSKFQTKKRMKKQGVDTNDGINELPDEILVDILSFLSFKEAARTSVVSSRWRNLWKQCPSLDFNADSALVKIKQHLCTLRPSERGNYINRERGKYIKWVNGVVRSYKADTLKEFRVRFDLDKLFSNSITRWVEFALPRHVEKLVLDFSPRQDYGYSRKHYAFPENLLTPSIDIKSLKELCLKCVNVTGEAIEFFLRNCPLLEKLVVVSTSKISNLRVSGPSLALKHLEMGVCFYLESVRISAPNLTSLSVHKVEDLFLENVPMLVELSANCMYRPDSINNLRIALSWRIYQLEILTLGFSYRTEVNFLSSFPQLPKLNKLVLEYFTEDKGSLMPLTFLIRAAPNLREFVLDLKLVGPVILRREEKRFAQFVHQQLQVFKFCGYHGRSSDVELVEYIFKNCVVLQKIVIDPNETSFSGLAPSPKQLYKVQIARDHAKKQLEAQVPHHVELVIL